MQIQAEVELISAQTDLDMFITAVKSGKPLPAPTYSVESYQSSQDVRKYKQELAARQNLEAADLDEDEDGMLVVVEPIEKVKKIL